MPKVNAFYKKIIFGVWVESAKWNEDISKWEVMYSAFSLAF